MQRFGLFGRGDFLQDFVCHWPTAKRVFLFDVQAAVAKSTMSVSW